MKKKKKKEKKKKKKKKKKTPNPRLINNWKKKSFWINYLKINNFFSQ